MQDNFFQALEAAQKSLADGDIRQIHTGRDNSGYRIIWVLSESPKWETWYSERQEIEDFLCQ
jgi:hypothetical protein